VIDKAKVQKIKSLLKPALIREPFHPETLECLRLIQANPLMNGMQLYRVGRLLGQGAYGKVNLGLHKITRKLVAIKSCKLQGVQSGGRRRNYEEIKILQVLQHKNHIKLLETFDTQTH
jgi:serine/threonine protein kinase